MFGSIERLKRKWFCPVEKSRVFQQNRHSADTASAREVAGSRHAWWLEFSRNDRRERSILGVSGGISQISGVPGLDGVVNIFLFFRGIRKIGR